MKDARHGLPVEQVMVQVRIKPRARLDILSLRDRNIVGNAFLRIPKTLAVLNRHILLQHTERDYKPTNMDTHEAQQRFLYMVLESVTKVPFAKNILLEHRKDMNFYQIWTEIEKYMGKSDVLKTIRQKALSFLTSYQGSSFVGRSDTRRLNESSQTES